MAINHKASLQVLLALRARLQLDRRTKFMALALFTDRSVYERFASTCVRCYPHNCMITESLTYFSTLPCCKNAAVETPLCIFRCIPLLDDERPTTLPLQGESLCTLVCLNKAAQCQSKDTCNICMADIQAAAAEVFWPFFTHISEDIWQVKTA
jgi:hypothetical protein